MKPLSLLTLRCSLALTATGLTLVSCDRANNNLSAQAQADVEAARAQAAADKLAAQELRDEAERLRSEAALRLQFDQIIAATKAAETPAPATETPVTAEATPKAPILDAVAPAPIVRDEEAYQPFYNELANQGSWMESPDYGYVFQPTISINEEWAPYTDGGWSYTDYGWAWESQESFGNICYHYGRWTRLRSIGWVWVPGRQWAPAWVSWRAGNDCIGWAPLPPAAGWNGALGIHSWVDGACHITPASYVFVTVQNFGHPSCRNVLYPKQHCEELFLQSKNVTRLTEVRTEGRGLLVKNEGPSVETLRPKLGEHLRERKIRFDDFSTGCPRVQAAPDGKELVMGQWSFRKAAAPSTKPVAKQKLQAGLDVREEVSPERQAAIRKVVANEAQQALRDMPALKPGQLIDRGPRSEDKPARAQTTVAPKPPVSQEIAGASKTSRPLPPVQHQLEPLKKPEPAPTVSMNQPTGPAPATKPIRPNVPRSQQDDSDRPQPAQTAQQTKPTPVPQPQPGIGQAQAEQEQLAQAAAQARKQQAMAQRQAQEQQDKLAQSQQQNDLAEQQRQASRAQQEAADRQRAQQVNDLNRKEMANRELVAKQREAEQHQAAQRQAQVEANRAQQAELAQRQEQMEAARRQQAELAQRLAQQEAMRRQQDELAQRQAQQDALRRQQEEASQRQAQQEAMRQKQEEANRRQQEQAEANRRQQQEASQRQAQQEAMRQRQEEANRRQQEQAEANRRQQQEASQRQAQQEAMRQKQEEANKRQQEAGKPRASGR